MRHQKGLSSSSSPTRSAAGKSPRKATTSMRNVTCVPTQLNCRYANKKCSNPRAVKRTGGLHTFCAMHRENANRNQRRLDLRKRLQKQAIRSVARVHDAIEPEAAPANAMQYYDQQFAALTLQHESLYEPLATPTPLRDEDVSTLLTLFTSQEDLNTEDPCCLDDIPMPRESTLLYELMHLDDALN